MMYVSLHVQIYNNIIHTQYDQPADSNQVKNMDDVCFTACAYYVQNLLQYDQPDDFNQVRNMDDVRFTAQP